MNLQTNRKTIQRVFPLYKYDQTTTVDRHIVYDAYCPDPKRRAYVGALNTYFRNLTEARYAVMTQILGIANPGRAHMMVNALIDIKRGRRKK